MLENPEEWADNDIIAAFALKSKYKEFVHRAENTILVAEDELFIEDSPQIHIAYISSENHYCSVRKCFDNSTSPPNLQLGFSNGKAFVI